MEAGRSPGSRLRAVFHLCLFNHLPSFSFSWTLNPVVLKRNYNCLVFAIKYMGRMGI